MISTRTTLEHLKALFGHTFFSISDLRRTRALGDSGNLLLWTNRVGRVGMPALQVASSWTATRMKVAVPNPAEDNFCV